MVAEGEWRRARVAADRLFRGRLGQSAQGADLGAGPGGSHGPGGRFTPAAPPFATLFTNEWNVVDMTTRDAQDRHHG
jgi:hypothetical protein